jgi:uncharacterized membrane protein YraQ (UPF0718 family)/YHS domain-containing protein
MGFLDIISDGLSNAFLMVWQVWWALAFGFAISAIVQAWVPRRNIERALGGSGSRPLAVATGLGAASSSCSYAAVAIAKSLFQKGASLSSAIAFELASTNLVWELGLVLWVLIGWQFTLAEYLGGIVMIVLVAALVRLFIPQRLEASGRERALAAATGHEHHSAGGAATWRERLTSSAAWSDVTLNFRGDWKMLWREITAGFLLAGFVGEVPDHVFYSLFLNGSPSLVRVAWGALVGPVIAGLSFVCSVGNVPLAAVLWSGGISFAGVLAFIYADLIVLPIVLIYRKYYGTSFAARLTGLLFVTMVIAALVIDALFAALGLIPAGARPSRTNVFGSIAVDYKLFLDLAGVVLFAVLFWLTTRRGAKDPMCGMTVDRGRALRLTTGARTFYFCSEGCRDAFAAQASPSS